MTKPSPQVNPRSIPVLSIVLAEEHGALSNVLEGPLCPGGRWKIETCRSLPSALHRLGKSRIPIVLWDGDLEPGILIEMLEKLERLPAPPLLIVTSRIADDRLWAEALDHGAYDVLAQPFDTNEVARTLSSAWRHWANQ